MDNVINSTLFLSGGGSADETYYLDDLFLKKSGERILYLPIGLKRTFIGYEECIDWFTKMVNSHGLIKQISVWVYMRGRAHEISINNFDAIYIGGASDTYRLHRILLENSIYPAFNSFIKEGGVIYGGSGGATILGKSINYDQIEKNLPKVSENSANLCLGYSIFTHLNSGNQNILSGASEGKAIGMPEGGGLIVEALNRKFRYVGDKPAIIFTETDMTFVNNNELTKKQ